MSNTTIEKPGTARRSSPKLRYEGGGRNLTSQAGLVLVIKLLDALEFSGLFRQRVRQERGHNAQYGLGDQAVC